MSASRKSGDDDTSRRDALPLNFVLNAYRIERVLGSGGFGIVYLARHEDLDRQVAIKEYLPIECAVREGTGVDARGEEYREAFEQGLTRFRDEARRLVELDEHPAIISCRDFFRANGTAYLVMEYVEGQPLSGLLRAREAEGRPFAQSDLLNVIVPLLEGLAKVHAAGIIHRDIKPSNILIRESDGKPVLLDFGAAKEGVAELSKSMAPFTEGYAAFEQVGEGKLGPWTDIYAVGAVMWRIVAGGNPPWVPPVPVRVESRAKAQLNREDDPLPSTHLLGKDYFSEAVLAGIEDSLRLREADRIQSCADLLRILRSETETLGGTSRSADGVAYSWVRFLQKSRELWVPLAALGVFLLVGAVLTVGLLNDPPTEDQIPEQDLIAVRQAAENGDASAQYRFGDMYFGGEGVPQDFSAALMWYRKAAEQGYAPAQTDLGFMYDVGIGVPIDDEEAVAWYRRAAEQGNARAQTNLGTMFDNGEGVPEDDQEAVAWYGRAAEQGDPSAQHLLGVMYDNGEGIAEDDQLAVAWYRMAAEQGEAAAQYDLGYMYDHGTGVAEDDQEAVAWYQSAAEQGHSWAQFSLGVMYSEGEGVPKDDREAAAWYRRAAEQGHAGAQTNLGVMYSNGEGVPHDDGEAVAWYRKAASQGDAWAQTNLGAMYASGEGVPEDDRKAVEWYRRAAEQGHAGAQTNLGVMYANGEGVPKNDREAVKWYRRAAEQGEASAQYNLGSSYAYGVGVSQDNLRAYAWWSLAAAQGDEDAREGRDRIGILMTPRQISEAQSLSIELMPR